MRVAVRVVEGHVDRDEGEDSLESPAVSLYRLLSSVTISIVDDRLRNTAESPWRVIDEIPNRILDVVPLDHFSTK